MSGGNLQFIVCKQRISWFSSNYLGTYHITPFISHHHPAPWRKVRTSSLSSFHDHTQDTPHAVGLLWTSYRSHAEVSDNTHMRQTSLPHRNSNPQSQQAAVDRSATGIGPTLVMTWRFPFQTIPIHHSRIQGCTNPGRQSPGRIHFYRPQYDLASCHPSGPYNHEITPIYLEICERIP